MDCHATAQTAQTTTATVVLTNTAGTTNGDQLTLILNSVTNTYTWTNVSSIPTGLRIQATNTAAKSATNLWTKLSGDYTNRLLVTYGSSTSVVLQTFVNIPLGGSVFSNWGTITFTTNAIANNTTMVVSNYLGSDATISNTIIAGTLKANTQTITNNALIGSSGNYTYINQNGIYSQGGLTNESAVTFHDGLSVTLDINGAGNIYAKGTNFGNYGIWTNYIRAKQLVVTNGTGNAAISYYFGSASARIIDDYVGTTIRWREWADNTSWTIYNSANGSNLTNNFSLDPYGNATLLATLTAGSAFINTNGTIASNLVVGGWISATNLTTGRMLVSVTTPNGVGITNSGTLNNWSLVNTNALDTSSLASGTVATARLGSGTASSSTYLRGDSTWATVSGSAPNFHQGQFFTNASTQISWLAGAKQTNFNGQGSGTNSGDFYIAGSLNPDIGDSRDVGSSSVRWGTFYGDRLNLTSVLGVSVIATGVGQFAGITNNGNFTNTGTATIAGQINANGGLVAPLGQALNVGGSGIDAGGNVFVDIGKSFYLADSGVSIIDSGGGFSFSGPGAFNGNLIMTNGTTPVFVGGNFFTLTNDVTVTNTTAQKSLISGSANGIGTTNLSAGFFIPSRTIHVRTQGVISTPISPGTLNVQIKFGSTVIISTGAQTLSASQANEFFRLSADITCRTAGATGTFTANGLFECPGTTALTENAWKMRNINPSTVTVDTTAAQAFDITVTYSTAAGNGITTQTLLLGCEN